MIRPLQKKQWGNKSNELTATAATQKQAWNMICVLSEMKGMDKPTFEDVYEITNN